MKIKELIKILESHPNPEADINITVNLYNPDDDELDVKCNHIEVWGEDQFEEDSIELFVSNYETE